MSSWAVDALDLVIVGATLELVGIALGLWEVWSTRQATRAFIKRAHTAYLSAHVTVGVAVGRPNLSVGAPSLVPTIDDCVRTLQHHVDHHEAKERRLSERLREEWRHDLKKRASTIDSKDRDLRDALDEFASDLGGGEWRRVLAVVLLLAGAAIQAGGSIWSMLSSTVH
jgi:hypothetical protein